MSDDAHKGFNAEKVFIWLLVFTAVEVAWGWAGHHYGWGKVPFWGGLILCALCKGLLIASYFMHLRFEGWIVKGLIAPTPFLILVIIGVLSPDISCNAKLNHPIGSMYDANTGDVKDMPHKVPGGASHEAAAAQPAETHAPAAAPGH